MNEPRRDLNERTLTFATRVIKLIKSLPKETSENIIAIQLSKSATSIGANYREACHAKSPRDYASKLKICEGEAAETPYWLQLISNSGIIQEKRLSNLIQESRELVAIFTSATKKAYINLSN